MSKYSKVIEAYRSSYIEGKRDNNLKEHTSDDTSWDWLAAPGVWLAQSASPRNLEVRPGRTTSAPPYPPVQHPIEFSSLN